MFAPGKRPDMAMMASFGLLGGAAGVVGEAEDGIGDADSSRECRSDCFSAVYIRLWAVVPIGTVVNDCGFAARRDVCSSSSRSFQRIGYNSIWPTAVFKSEPNVRSVLSAVDRSGMISRVENSSVPSFSPTMLLTSNSE